MLVGTALYVHLMVYMGLSLFIIRRALRIYGCIRFYAYNLTVVHAPHRCTLVYVHLTVHPIEPCSKILSDSEFQGQGPKNTKLLSLLSMAVLSYPLLTDVRCISLYNCGGFRISQTGVPTPEGGDKSLLFGKILVKKLHEKGKWIFFYKS